MVSTYVLYNAGDALQSGDTRSANLIAEVKGFLLLAVKYIVNDKVDPPVVPTAEIANNDIICLGSWIANPYSKLYFPNLRFDKLYNPDNFPNQPEIWKLAGEFGISADGKHIITVKKRANGTTVTLIAGVCEQHTWESANVFVSPKISPLIPLGISAATIGGVAGYTLVKRGGE